MKPHTCPVCQGMRQIQNPDVFGYTAVPLVISCPACNGAGLVWEPGDLSGGLRQCPGPNSKPLVDANEILERCKQLIEDTMSLPAAKLQIPVEPKTLDGVDTSDVGKKVSDVVVFGNPDLWRLVCKASSQSQGWMKSTKAMALPNGVLVQVSTQQGEHVAEALAFIPCGPSHGPYGSPADDVMTALGVGPKPPDPPTGDPREEAERMREEAEEGEDLADGEDPHLGSLENDVFRLKK